MYLELRKLKIGGGLICSALRQKDEGEGFAGLGHEESYRAGLACFSCIK